VLKSLLTDLFGHGSSGRKRAVSGPAKPRSDAPLKLHIGGKTRHADWKILDVQPGPQVDYVGHCGNLSTFEDESVHEIYASHVLEHLGYQTELPLALREFHRTLVAGGMLRISVPNLTTLCELFIDPALDAAERFHVMRMMFGGQIDKADFHYVGLNEEFLRNYLRQSGFADIVRVDDFGLFDDTSRLEFKGRPISLNLCARKPQVD
jgi:predicted SAM-dependent methyltransferase